MIPALPTSSEFRSRILSLYYGIWLLGPAVLVASLFSLLDLTGMAGVWLFSSAGGFAVLASTMAAKRQLFCIEPITTYLIHCSEDRAVDEDCRAGFAAILDLPRRLAMVAMTSWLAVGAMTAGTMALRFRSFGMAESAIVVTAGLIAGFVAGCILFFAVKREVELVRGEIAAKIPDPEMRRAQGKPISLRSKIIFGAAGMAAVPLVVALVFFSVKMNAGIRDFTLRWQGGVLDELVDQLAEQELRQHLWTWCCSISPNPMQVTMEGSTPSSWQKLELNTRLASDAEAVDPGISVASSRGARSRMAVFSWCPRPFARWNSRRAESGSHSRAYSRSQSCSVESWRG